MAIVWHQITPRTCQNPICRGCDVPGPWRLWCWRFRHTSAEQHFPSVTITNPPNLSFEVYRPVDVKFNFVQVVFTIYINDGTYASEFSSLSHLNVILPSVVWFIKTRIKSPWRLVNAILLIWSHVLNDHGCPFGYVLTLTIYRFRTGHDKPINQHLYCWTGDHFTCCIIWSSE